MEEELADDRVHKGFEDVENKDEYEHLMLLLTPAQRQLMAAVKENDGSVEEAATACGVTYDYARKCYSRAVQRLRCVQAN